MPRTPPFADVTARALAAAGALGAAAGIATYNWAGPSVTTAACSLVVGSTALLAQSRRLPAQLLARGVWLSTALLASIDALVGARVERLHSAGVLAAIAVAAIAMGRRGLGASDVTDTVFQPHAHRSRLIAVLCLATANVVSLSFFGLIWLEFMGRMTLAVPLAALLAVSAAGIYRMRAWGVLATAASATLLGSLALAMAVPTSPLLYPFFVFSSLIQIVLLGPLLRAAGRKVLGTDPTRARFRVAAPLASHAASLREIEAEQELDADERAPERVVMRVSTH